MSNNFSDKSDIDFFPTELSVLDGGISWGDAHKILSEFQKFIEETEKTNRTRIRAEADIIIKNYSENMQTLRVALQSKYGSEKEYINKSFEFMNSLREEGYHQEALKAFEIFVTEPKESILEILKKYHNEHSITRLT